VKDTLDAKEVKLLIAAIDDLIEIKILIRKIVPNYELDVKLHKKFLSNLESLRSKLLPLFSKYLSQSSELTKKKSKEEFIEEIRELAGNVNMILVSSNSNKKKLKNMGIDPRNIIVTGGPLFFENYLKVNPNISDKVMVGIKRKCESLINMLKKINWEERDLIFLYEFKNVTDKIILDELGNISELIGKDIIIHEIISEKDLEA
jgi:hypothetical protein